MVKHCVTCLSSQRPGINPRPVFVIFVVDKVLLEQVYSWVLLLSPVRVILPLLCSYLHLNVILTRRAETMAGNVQKAATLQKLGSLWYQSIFTSFLVLIKWGTATGFSLRTLIFPHHHHSTNASYSSSSYYSITRKVNWWSLDIFHKQWFSQKSQSVG
jgi:hypothetical protein